MDLTALTQEDVSSLADNRRVFASGEDYARTGRIFKFSVTPTGISARLHGSYGDYTVTVTPEVKTRCTCPYDGKVCKHIVAVLLHYLEGGYSEVAGVRLDVPSALELTIEKMSGDDLRALLLRLIRDNTDIRRALLENVHIAPALLRGQPTDPKQVRTLKKSIDKTFGELDGNGYEYEEGEVDVNFDYVFDSVSALHPNDQSEVLWHLVEQGNKYVEDYDLNTDFLERAVQSYGAAVARLELPSAENRLPLNLLMEALHWTMCEYGDVADALHEALETVAGTPGDVQYVIGKLEQSSEAQVRDWAISLRRKSGDEAGYLKARQANLHTEAQYLELADYFAAQGKSAKSLQTLEAWVTAAADRTGSTRDRSEILRRLTVHYTEAKDDVNLCRVLLAQARLEGLTLALYRQIQTVAERIGTWIEHRPALMKYSRGAERARIILYERDWERAIAFARLPGTEERVQALIADAVKETHPDEAIALYDILVQASIRLFNRSGYSAAARYASEVKRIYRDIAGEPELAARYIAEIRREHSRRPALREEFAGL